MYLQLLFNFCFLYSSICFSVFADVFVPFQFSAPDIKMGLIFIEAYYILKKFWESKQDKYFLY